MSSKARLLFVFRELRAGFEVQVQLSIHVKPLTSDGLCLVRDV